MVHEDMAKGIREAFALPPAPGAPPADKAKRFYPQELYVLQGPVGPVALYTQQCRALNLVWGLAYGNDDGTGLKDKKVVVVGAGAAGLTAAVGAALAQAHVWVLEKAGTLMSLQLGCEHRFLHPRFHYWPKRRSQSAAAALPLLTWSVGTAGAVADTIIDQFHQINDRLARAAERGKGLHRIKLEYNVRDIVCEEGKKAPAGCSVLYNVEDMKTGAVGAKPEICCDILIFAVGFGVERTIDGLAPRSYWRTDPLTQPSIGLSGRKLRVLVAGDGDGGAIDVLRAALNRFDHGPFIDRIIEMTMENRPLREGVEAADETVGTYIEKEGRRLKEKFRERCDEVRAKAATMLNQEYENLLNENKMEALSKYLARLARTDVEVTWIGQLPFASSWETYTLNRLLVWLICKKLSHVTYRPQLSLLRVDPVPIGGAGPWLGYTAYLQPRKLVDGGYENDDVPSEEKPYDEVIVRYGGIRPLLSEFKEWGRELHERREKFPGGEASLKLWEPVPGIVAFFARALDDLRDVAPSPSENLLKASLLGKVERRTRTIDGKDWPLFRIKLSIHPTAPLTPDEMNARKGALRHDDWVEYHLHPYRNGILRRANRGPKGDFSLVVFTRDDYWVDVSLGGGRRLRGGWLSKLLEQDVPESLISCAKRLWPDYDTTKPPPLEIRDRDPFDLDFERELARAPDDQSAEPET